MCDLNFGKNYRIAQRGVAELNDFAQAVRTSRCRNCW